MRNTTSCRSRNRYLQTHFLLCFLAIFLVREAGAFVTFSQRQKPHQLPLRVLRQYHMSVGRRRTLTSSSSSSLSMAVGKTGGSVIESAEQYAQQVLEADGSKPVLVFWTAPWCGPCRLSIPVVKDVMKQFSGDIQVVEVCTDDLPDVAAGASVVSIPTIQIFYRGELKDTIIGCVAKSVLASAVDKVLEDVAAQLGVGDSGKSA